VTLSATVYVELQFEDRLQTRLPSGRDSLPRSTRKFCSSFKFKQRRLEQSLRSSSLIPTSKNEGQSESRSKKASKKNRLSSSRGLTLTSFKTRFSSKLLARHRFRTRRLRNSTSLTTSKFLATNAKSQLPCLSTKVSTIQDPSLSMLVTVYLPLTPSIPFVHVLLCL
jgi:hypothetical protein